MYEITLIDLSFAFIPVAITLFLLYSWSVSSGSAMLSIFRMLIQLLLIGYVLNYIFVSDSYGFILLILMIMLLAASWISLSALPIARLPLLRFSFLAILFGGGLNLIFISQGVLHIEPWYQPQVLIPIAGMIFSNSMNIVSLAGERFFSELKHDSDYLRARNIALQAAMIPIINSLLAVGLVSLPGMMTGQILSGVSPLIAARYQIMVMCMIFGSAGLSAALFLHLLRHHYRQLVPQT